MKYQIWKSRNDVYINKWLIFTPDLKFYIEESFKDAIQRMNIHELSRENV